MPRYSAWSVTAHQSYGVAFWIVELAEIHGDVELAIVEAEITVVVGDGNLLQQLTLLVRLHEGRRERPVNRRFVRANSLKVVLVSPFAQDFE